MLSGLIDTLVLSLREFAPEVTRDNFIFPGKFGDVSCNIAFSAAKKAGKNPVAYSEELSKKVESNFPTFIEKVEAKGGYLNFFLNYPRIFELILKEGEIKSAGKKILVEFSQPNPCKAMHIGNSRTIFLGDSISEIIKYRGSNAVRANYYNDLGKQFAKVLFAVQIYGFKGEGKSDHELANLYVQLNKDLKDHPEYEEKIQDILNRLEKNDPALEKDRRFVLEKALSGFDQTYNSLGVRFDVNFFESDFREEGKSIAREMEKKGLAFYSPEGTLVASLEKYGLPNTVLLRSDGTGLYITSDIALTIHRFNDLNLSECIWVVGSEQNLNFQQLFKIIELLGYPFAKDCKHMSYGLITLCGSKMSSRSGEFILLDDLIDEVVEKAAEEVRKRNPDIGSEELKILARMIGIGAIKYDTLKVERNKGADFNPSKAIQFEGNTGPYIQYMAVRCGSILKKASANCSELNISQYSPAEPEKSLMRKFMEFDIVTQKAAEQLKPNLICNYAFELATVFSQFYESCKVIGSQEEPFRLPLVQKTKNILEKCLELLRISIPERM